MVEFQEAAVKEFWVVAVAPERFGPWAKERADSECLEQNQQTSSGHGRMAMADGQTLNPLKEWLVSHRDLLVRVQRVWEGMELSSS